MIWWRDTRGSTMLDKGCPNLQIMQFFNIVKERGVGRGNLDNASIFPSINTATLPVSQSALLGDLQRCTMVSTQSLLLIHLCWKFLLFDLKKNAAMWKLLSFPQFVYFLIYLFCACIFCCLTLIFF